MYQVMNFTVHNFKKMNFYEENIYIYKVEWKHNTYLEAFEFDNFLDSINNENLLIIIYITNVSSMKPTFNIYGICCGLQIIQIPYKLFSQPQIKISQLQVKQYKTPTF